MPTRGATATQPARRRTAGGPDAITLLKEDHRKVAGLFREFDKATAARKPKIAGQICEELTIHATLEEEILYPEARQFLDTDKGEDLLDEAEVEHEGIKGLVGKILASGGDDDLFEAQVTVLQEYVKHHVREEETAMFPKLRKSKFDAREIGARLDERRKELMGK
ncbi:MAG: hemerythrin domain-containing protein [Reyranella sp.]|nr:hemerythrin domain-containing protein [Reyranella sp.]